MITDAPKQPHPARAQKGASHRPHSGAGAAREQSCSRVTFATATSEARPRLEMPRKDPRAARRRPPPPLRLSAPSRHLSLVSLSPCAHLREQWSSVVEQLPQLSVSELHWSSWQPKLEYHNAMYFSRQHKQGCFSLR
jgi:hypothetical protein